MILYLALLCIYILLVSSHLWLSWYVTLHSYKLSHSPVQYTWMYIRLMCAVTHVRAHTHTHNYTAVYIHIKHMLCDNTTIYVLYTYMHKIHTHTHTRIHIIIGCIALQSACCDGVVWCIAWDRKRESKKNSSGYS